MLMSELIIKKRDGGKLTAEEIKFIVDGYTAGDIPDYQVSAFLMAVFFRGLDREEYLSLLRQYTWEGEHLTFRWKGTKYQLYYVPAKRTTTPVPIPAGHGYTISGEDEEGIIPAGLGKKKAPPPKAAR